MRAHQREIGVCPNCGETFTRSEVAAAMRSKGRVKAWQCPACQGWDAETIPVMVHASGAVRGDAAAVGVARGVVGALRRLGVV